MNSEKLNYRFGVKLGSRPKVNSDPYDVSNSFKKN
jgi:hypothetical protein